MYSRSSQSLAFEALWRSLRGERLIPDRGDFTPRKAARFLPNILLMEAPGVDHQSFRIRVAGRAFRRAASEDIAGTDMLDMLPEEYRAGAVATGYLMISNPCGLWQISRVRSAGYAGMVEMTAFPVTSVSDAVQLVIAHVLPLAEAFPVTGTVSSAVKADTAVEFRFLDIGAGEPRWPLAA